MAFSAGCCLNLSPPPSGSSPSSSRSSTKTDQVSWPRKENSLKSKCVVGLTCMIISLEMSNLMSGEGLAIAQDLQLIGERKEVTRWSDKRMCPPWQLNSLETIVPENLPRPSTRRRWESVGHSTTAPAVKILFRAHTKSDCFSM
ncbi:protein CHLOROPLAST VESICULATION [Vitis vinifera]|uniref:protein CHLOROPLAST VESICULATION n=1 Tax=Vitis vinifera TaxID=29760 RepID=UPI00015C8F72|nr:protein CHLOROPLAST VESICULATION [Vitis vinifera]|eukprot:XP_002284793.1 PREDICTED: uncharacterized protein LOC100261242 [Vitis vinifera]